MRELLRVLEHPVIGLAVSLVLFVLLWLTLRRKSFFERYVGEASASSLGVVRFIVCFALLEHVIYEPLGSLALVPHEFRHSMGIMRLCYALPGFESFVHSESALTAFRWITGGLLALAAVGWRTRLTLPLAAACYLLFAGLLRHLTWFWHMGLLPMYVLFAMILLPVGDGFSLDRLRRVARGEVPPGRDERSATYGWAIFACWTVLACAYTAAGWSKVRTGGWHWWDPLNMRQILYANALEKDILGTDWPLAMTTMPDWVFGAQSLPSMAVEMFFFLVLFSVWARRVMPPIMLGMHVGILLLMDVVFADLMICLFAFVNWSWLRRATAARLSRGGTQRLLYDGASPRFGRTVAVLRSLDVLERLEPVDFRATDLEAERRRAATPLPVSRLEREMALVADGRAYWGYEAYVRMARLLPIGWLLQPLLVLPGGASIGRWLYGRLSGRRWEPVRRDPSSAPARGRFPILRPTGMRLPAAYPGYVAGLAAALFFVWASRLEAYPATAMQMFSGRNSTGRLEYRELYVRFADGTSRRTYLAEAIPVLHNTRFRPIVEAAFRENQQPRVGRYFSQVGQLYNDRVRPSSPVVGFEVRLFEWDFVAHPDDRGHGTLIDRVLYEVAPPTPLAQPHQGGARLTGSEH